MNRLLAFFLCILLAGCKAEFIHNEKELSSNEAKQVVGTSLGLVDESAVNKSNFVHKLNSLEEYSPEIKIVNHYPKKMKYRLFFLLDYKQTNVNFNHKDINYLEVEVEPNEEKKFKVKLANIPDGLHDFIIISVRNPNDYLMEEQLIPPPRTYIYRRVTLLVGETEKTPNTKFEEVAKSTSLGFEEINSNSANVLQGVVYLTNTPRNTPGEVITLLNRHQNPLWANFAIVEPNTNFAIIAFLDNKQLSLPNSYFHTSKRGMINYPINVNADTDKPNNLIVAVIENPFVKIEKESGEIINTPWSVLFTNKITLNPKLE